MPPPTATGFGERILRAGGLVVLAHLCFKLAALAQVMVCGRVFAPEVLDAAYVFAFEGILFSCFLVGEEIIGPSFLPVFAKEMGEKGEQRAWGMANALLGLQALLLLAVIAVLMAFPDAVVRLVTCWKADGESGARSRLAGESLRWMAPGLFFLSVGSTTYVVLNGYKRFFLAAFGDAAMKIAVILAVLAGLVLGAGTVGWQWLAAGVAAGGLAKFLTHLLGLRDKLALLRPGLSWRDPGLRQMALLALPLLAGILFAKARDIFNNITVLSSLDTAGLMTANSFAQKLYKSAGFLIPYALSIAAFPYFCDLSARGEKAELGRLLTTSGRLLLAAFIPLSVFCCLTSHHLTELVFQGGRFGPQMTTYAAVAAACYVLVLPAYAMEALLMQACFSERRMVAVTVLGMACSALSMAVSWAGIFVLGASGVTALVVVAAGYTVSRTIKSAALALLLKRAVPLFPARETGAFLAKTLAASALASLAGLGALRLAEALAPALHLARKALLAAELGAAAAVTAALFLLLARLTGLREPFDMISWVRARLSRGKKEGTPA